MVVDFSFYARHTGVADFYVVSVEDFSKFLVRWKVLVDKFKQL